MADAMCGPSNALQQFKQQTDIDRTLQQDRLTSRQRPAQGFRSHTPGAGLLDPEFEAFQAGIDPSLALDHAPPFQRPTGGLHGPSQAAPSWAADFQRLQISPQPQHHVHLQPGPSTADWAQGFREQLAHTAPKLQTSSPSPLAFQQRARGFGNYDFQSSFQQPNYAFTAEAKGKEPVMTERFDDAAFARAFDQASEDMMADVEHTKESENIEEIIENIEAAAEQSATEMLRQSEQDLEELTAEATTARMHTSDFEYEPQQLLQEEQMQEQKQYEDDALAATAQELLEKVEHNQSDKFRNSQFLGLMRKLRDREVRVEGDKMVETATATSVQDDTLNASSIANSDRVYFGKPQPLPLQATVDTRQAEHGQTIPPQEQDHDAGRIDPKDGQEVVDLLNETGPITDDIGEFVQSF
ncbi:Hypothetical predicted protein [Lecanosticta acicola]|uniref:Peroxin 20 n=1 Tax=Lecanosticta acicola TaxID=111012 RepID=A0AAI8Z6W5_9PEZI|nr:Hypothetical predicted protein [Lecanosticta acicola]